MNQLQLLTAPVGRVLLSLVFITSGISKISGYAGTQGYMEAMGVPGALLPFVIALEVLGGLAVLLGFQARLAALALSGFCIVSAVLFHAVFSDQMQLISFMKNISIAGGFLMVFAHGAGAYSIDNRRSAA